MIVDEGHVLFLFGIALGIVAILASFITIGFEEKHGEKSE